MTRRSSRSRFTLVLLVLTSITVITLDFRGDSGGLIGTVRDAAVDALSPVRSAAGTVLGPVGDAISGVTGYGDLEDENARLRRRIAELEGASHADAGAAAELRDLLRQLDIPYVGDLPTVPTRVVSTPISNFEQTIELAAGRDDGIAVDMPVVTGAGLVGIIVEVSDTRSVVRLVTDPGSAVGIRFTRTGELGVAEGDGAGRHLRVALVDAEADVRRREVAVTSGLDGSLYPAGIPVGRVVERGSDAGDLDLRLTIEPVADLDHLRYVTVIRTEVP